MLFSLNGDKSIFELLGQGPVYQYGVFRVPKNGILVNK